MKLKSKIWIRLVAVIILIIASYLFAQSYFIGNYIKNITGVDGSASFSIIDLFQGKVVFKNVLILSPKQFYNAPSVWIGKIEIKPNWQSFFCNNKTIKHIIVSGIVVNNIYNPSGDNNLNSISSHIVNYFKKRNAESAPDDSCTVNTFESIGTVLDTYYKNGEGIVSSLPNVLLKDVLGKHGLMDTLSALLSSSLSSNLLNNKNMSTWNKPDVWSKGDLDLKISSSAVGLRLI